MESADPVSRLAVLAASTHFVDDALGHLLDVAPHARIIRKEQHLRRFMRADWRLRASAATDAAVRLKGGAAIDAIHAEMRAWGSDVGVHVKSGLRSAYGIGRREGARKAARYLVRRAGRVQKGPSEEEARIAELLSSFDTIDEAAIAALEAQLFWIGGHYNDAVSETVAETARRILEAGHGREEAGRTMRDALEAALGTVAIPTGFLGGADGYFETVASAAVNSARNFGQLMSIARAGVTRYVFFTVEDERVCEVCGHMHGKTFKTSQGLAVMANVLAATNPAGVKAAQPWLSVGSMLAVSPNAGDIGEADAAALAAAGFCVPPLHGRCRCYIDVEIEGD